MFDSGASPVLTARGCDASEQFIKKFYYDPYLNFFLIKIDCKKGENWLFIEDFPVKSVALLSPDFEVKNNTIISSDYHVSY